MPTTSHDQNASRAKQKRAPGVQTNEGARERAKKTNEELRETNAKQDKERSDWEGMTPKPEQGEDDIAAPGQLPETD
jgi:hypothetical protein